VTSAAQRGRDDYSHEGRVHKNSHNHGKTHSMSEPQDREKRIYEKGFGKNRPKLPRQQTEKFGGKRLSNSELAQLETVRGQSRREALEGRAIQQLPQSRSEV